MPGCIARFSGETRFNAFCTVRQKKIRGIKPIASPINIAVNTIPPAIALSLTSSFD